MISRLVFIGGERGNLRVQGGGVQVPGAGVRNLVHRRCHGEIRAMLVADFIKLDVHGETVEFVRKPRGVHGRREHRLGRWKKEGGENGMSAAKASAPASWNQGVRRGRSAGGERMSARERRPNLSSGAMVFKIFNCEMRSLYIGKFLELFQGPVLDNPHGPLRFPERFRNFFIGEIVDEPHNEHALLIGFKFEEHCAHPVR